MLIDSEGIGAFDEDDNHDTKIFLLALLLCSFFIYNSMGTIDENALSNLSLIVSLNSPISCNIIDQLIKGAINQVRCHRRLRSRWDCKVFSIIPMGSQRFLFETLGHYGKSNKLEGLFWECSLGIKRSKW